MESAESGHWVRQFFTVPAVVLGLLTTAWTQPSPAQEAVTRPPHLDAAGHAAYQDFLRSRHHRAFAIAPGGRWAWVSDLPDPDVAESEAIRACSRYTDQRCTIFAIDDQVVFDQEAWAASWSPYLGAAEALRQPLGTGTGMRFPDLALGDPDGAPVTLSAFRGKVVFLHVWGSWCSPCQTEFPELQTLYDSLRDDPDTAFVFVQAREAIARSRAWARQRGLTVPLYDSGAQGPSDHVFRRADGGRIEDRVLTPLFPATYVLDKNGIILFVHTGPSSHWRQYAPLLRHAASHSAN